MNKTKNLITKFLFFSTEILPKSDQLTSFDLVDLLPLNVTFNVFLTSLFNVHVLKFASVSKGSSSVASFVVVGGRKIFSDIRRQNKMETDK